MDDMGPEVPSEGRSVESEILFEKIKALPKRSQYYGIHRKLSWQCQREIRQYERDFDLFNKEYIRSEAKIRERMEKLKKRKRELIDSGAHSSILIRHLRKKNNAVKDKTWRFETSLEECKIIDILVSGEDNCEESVKRKIRREQTVCVNSAKSVPKKTPEKIRSLSSTEKNKGQQRLSSFSGKLAPTDQD